MKQTWVPCLLDRKLWGKFSWKGEKVLGSQTAIPKGLKRNQKYWKGGGINDLEFGGHGRVEHYGISEGKVDLAKKFMLPEVGYGYFLESPNIIFLHFSIGVYIWSENR